MIPAARRMAKLRMSKPRASGDDPSHDLDTQLTFA